MNLLENNRIPSLDGLRTISVGLVVLSHYLPLAGSYDNWNLGMLGVKFFFVISGFLITNLLLKETEKTGSIDLTKFYFRRTLRIFPPYYFYLFVIFILSRTVANFPGGDFTAPLTYTSNYDVSTTWNLLHTWSLSVEEQFYLIFPFVLLFFGRKKVVVVLAALVLLSPVIRLTDHYFFSEAGKMWIYYGFHANADGLATGCLMAIFYEKLHQNRYYIRILNSKLFYIAPLLLVLTNSIIEPRRFYLGATFTISNILIVMCIDWAITNYKSNAAGRLLNTSPMEKIGVMSYSIYLWQQPFLNRDSMMWFNEFPYNIAGIVLFSSISYFLIEKMSLRWRSTLEEKLLRRKPKPPVLQPAHVTIG
ncbi:MAG: acyltransferase [Pyrinomonadaceae bacterium]|nr:acyltransferase [Pyrinomonadaceae bacterium]